MTALSDFSSFLAEGVPVETLREGLIGDGLEFDTPFGRQRLTYADYTASGRALTQVEDFVAQKILPFYANSHTETSFCGRTITQMREESRAYIARTLNAGSDCHVVFTGSGATAAINRIVSLLDITRRIAAGQKIIVLIGPYEHHSNILPWRESGAEVREVAEAETGGVDLSALEAELSGAEKADLVIGSFSAASNVTGILTNPDPVTRLLKAYGALAIWDYACAAPYLDMDMNSAEDCAKDAIVYSPHKFIGGPGASGVMALRDTIVTRTVPSAPGGGSVTYVSPWRHAYSASVEEREEAGTPNIIGDIRVALALMAREAIGYANIAARNAVLRETALAAWREVPQLKLLGLTDTVGQLPIFSFQVMQNNGELVHHQVFTRMLSDVLGIQARAGCACAGPYGHRLLGVDRATSDAIIDKLESGNEQEKPGWTRLNLSYLLTDGKADAIISGVAKLAMNSDAYMDHYIREM